MKNRKIAALAGTAVLTVGAGVAALASTAGTAQAFGCGGSCPPTPSPTPAPPTDHHSWRVNCRGGGFIVFFSHPPYFTDHGCVF